MVDLPRPDHPAEDGAGRDHAARRILKSFHEDVWERVPAEFVAPDLAARRAFLLDWVRAGDRALDLGCGEGTFTAILAGAGAEVVGADLAERALNRARAAHPALRFVAVGDDADLPFDDASFDVVWCSQVIERVPDTARFLGEARRVLTRGGALLLTTPASGRWRRLVRGAPDPLGDELHSYDRRSLARVLDALGFADVRVVKLNGARALGATLTAVARRG